MALEYITAERIEAALSKPLSHVEDGLCRSVETFDPWDDVLNGPMYGSYTSEMDVLAIKAIEATMSFRTTDLIREYGLAAEMMLEIFCASGLMYYGTSPRHPFINPEIGNPLAQKLVDKWQELYAAEWEDADDIFGPNRLDQYHIPEPPISPKYFLAHP